MKTNEVHELFEWLSFKKQISFIDKNVKLNPFEEHFLDVVSKVGFTEAANNALQAAKNYNSIPIDLQVANRKKEGQKNSCNCPSRDLFNFGHHQGCPEKQY